MCVCRKEQSSLTQGPSDFLRSMTFPQDLGKGRMKLDEQGMWLGEQRSHGIEAGKCSTGTGWETCWDSPISTALASFQSAIRNSRHQKSISTSIKEEQMAQGTTERNYITRGESTPTPSSPPLFSPVLFAFISDEFIQNPSAWC